MKKFLIFLIPILFILIISSPYLIWKFSEEIELNIAIVDKTVPDHTYREHKGLSWLLNHQKIVQRNSQDSYKPEEDYVGFHPLPNKEYKIKELPVDTEELDIIYLADTYGVFHEEYYGENKEGTRSEKIYGGMTMNEIEKIKRYVYSNNTTLMAEFNSFASPTEEAPREALTELLSLEWTGWIGRYFSELNPIKSEEVPAWAIGNYETQYEKEWGFDGGGFVIVYEDDTIVVLEDNVHIGEKGINVTFTEKGHSLFNLKDSPKYNYWFDIVIPYDNQDILANYQWDLTDKGEALLNDFSIPSQFPAVISSNRLGFQSYYFAGDYVDTDEIPSFYKMKGMKSIKKWFTSDQTGSTQGFFWKTYVPMMQDILRLEKNKEVPVEKKGSIFEDETGRYSSKMSNNVFQVFQDGQWVDLVIKGVNLGIAKPGSFPGETAITEEEYYRWFEMIGEMNANTIRVYTLHPPGFYRALERYNQQHEESIYLFHGVWIEEEGLEETLDAFDPNNMEPFKKEIANIINAVHGNLHLPENPGHASGDFTANVSPYVIGWILGIEWYPPMVLQTNETYSSMGEYNGKHIYTEGAEAFEYWLAEVFDYTLEYEHSHYRWKRPISFTNWVTTDLLEHPSEPSEEEDLVGIDPNVIYLKDHIKTGQFASYHVYPYYPDFLNHEPDYLDFIDHRGEKNSYAAYLRDLHEAHRIPVLIAEFGIPSSRGLTHENPFGWNQGFISEQEQGEINVRLFEDIIHEGMLGGLVFAWHDEWFKRTWNTMELDSPYRRPYWSDAQTNEQNFGLLSFDTLKIPLRGMKEDWVTEPLYHNGERELKALYMDYDERYLYVRFDIEGREDTFDLFNTMNALLLFDTIPGQGNSMVVVDDVNVEVDGGGIDFVVNLNGMNSSRVLVDSYYDVFHFQYGHELKMIDEMPYASVKNNGVFHPIHLTISKKMTIPSTGEVIPFTSYETGILRHGTADPQSKEYDSLADFYVNAEEGVIELRLPWLLLNVKDPSQKEVTGDVWKNGFNASEFIEGIRVGVILSDSQLMKITDSFPSLQNNTIKSSDMAQFKWESWDGNPPYKERLKPSYFILQELFEKY